jgi:hypothetical protein
MNFFSAFLNLFHTNILAKYFRGFEFSHRLSISNWGLYGGGCCGVSGYLLRSYM